MKMRPTKLLIFGSPKAGTPVMLAAPSIAIDLPLKILVWEDEAGKAWISYNSADYLRSRHNVPWRIDAESPWRQQWRPMAAEWPGSNRVERKPLVWRCFQRMSKRHRF